MTVIPHLSVLVLTRNRRDALLKCLDSVLGQLAPSDQAIVVVNGTDDDTAPRIAERWGSVKILDLPENVGCPGGRNVGIHEAAHDWVLCLDDDATVGPSFISEVRAATRRWPDAEVIAGIVRDEFHTAVSGVSAGTDVLVSTFSGGAAAVRRGPFMRLGGYVVDGLREGEERDLSLRIIASGGKIVRCPGIIIDHHPVITVERREEVVRSAARNATRTAFRYFPMALAIPMATFNGLRVIRAARRTGATMAAVEGLLQATRELSDVRRRSQRFGAEELVRIVQYRKSTLRRAAS